MPLPKNWRNPITEACGSTQTGVDPAMLLPSRRDLWRKRLELQRQLIRGSINRYTPIRVTPGGVIVDGHHAVRAAAEERTQVAVLIVDMSVKPIGLSIWDLPVL